MASLVAHSLDSKFIKILTIRQDDKSPYHTLIKTCVDNTTVLVPFYYGRQHQLLHHPKLNQLMPENNHHYCYKNSPVEFTGLLRPYQQTLRRSVVDFLNQHRCAVLSAYVGSGKTIIAINIAAKIKLRTLIVINRLVLCKQWQQSILDFTSCQRVDVLTVKTQKTCTSEFVIVNAINIDKIECDILKSFGTVIIDECHSIMSGIIAKKLLCLQPKYLLGCSATPFRKDGFNIMFQWFFGNFIVSSPLHRQHHVIKINTNITFTSQINRFTGKIDFNALLNDLSTHFLRNQLIVRTICAALKATDQTHRCLVLVKRIEHGNDLTNLLLAQKVSVDRLYGSYTPKTLNNNVIIATCSKAGVGFDCPKLNTLILAAPIKSYFIQYLGRVMRTQFGTPTVFDFVDNHSVLQNHWFARRQIYKKHGGIFITPTATLI